MKGRLPAKQLHTAKNYCQPQWYIHLVHHPVTLFEPSRPPLQSIVAPLFRHSGCYLWPSTGIILFRIFLIPRTRNFDCDSCRSLQRAKPAARIIEFVHLSRCARRRVSKKLKLPQCREPKVSLPSYRPDLRLPIRSYEENDCCCGTQRHRSFPDSRLEPHSFRNLTNISFFAPSHNHLARHRSARPQENNGCGMSHKTFHSALLSFSRDIGEVNSAQLRVFLWACSHIRPTPKIIVRQGTLWLLCLPELEPCRLIFIV